MDIKTCRQCKVVTADHVTVTCGDRVFNYYDGHWGTLGCVDREGWGPCYGDDGRHALLNGERLSTYQPAWSKR